MSKNPKQILIEIISRFGFVEGETLVLQGTMNPDEAYPETFVTFWTDYTDDKAHFDNKTQSVEWSFSVILYSSDAAIVNTKPFELMEALREAGFVPQGKGQDIMSDEPTHTGWVIEYLYAESTEF